MEGGCRLSKKILNDKYYTPPDLAKYCIEKTFETIRIENITEIIEPSAGNGSFSRQIDGCIAYDIKPESDGIYKKNFLELDLEYVKGRLIIGNPPFGKHMKLAQDFFKHSVKHSDFIAFILPISQLNNQNSLYEFDLIHSEDLGKKIYTDRELHCCFNIYKRPKSGTLNKKKQSKLKDISIYRQDSKKYSMIDKYDLRMCYWGNGSAGKILSSGQNYSAEYKIVIHNKDIKSEIIECLTSADWNKELNKIAMLKIQQFHIHDLLRKHVKGIS